MSPLEKQVGFFFPTWKIALPHMLLRKTWGSPACAMQLMGEACLPRPAGVTPLLAPGEPVRSDSWTNQRASLCETHWVLQAKESKWLCGIPQIMAAVRVITVWDSAFSRRTVVTSWMESSVQTASPFTTFCCWANAGPEELTDSMINNLSKCPEWQIHLEPTLCSCILH